jgi:hypothetical protein
MQVSPEGPVIEEASEAIVAWFGRESNLFKKKGCREMESVVNRSTTQSMEPCQHPDLYSWELSRVLMDCVTVSVTQWTLPCLCTCNT